jgi:hypothetical protein
MAPTDRFSQFILAQHLAQPEFLNLAGRCGRQCVPQDQSFRDILDGKLLGFEECRHLREVERLPRPRHDDGAGALSQTFVGISNDRDLGNDRMLIEQ